jgi:UDPglucose 6-dehydrogenase
VLKAERSGRLAQIVVVGSGVVGQATGKGLLSKGHKVTFVDTKEDVLIRLSNKGYDTAHPEELDLAEVDVVFVSVSTPTESGRIALTHLASAASMVGEALGRAVGRSPQRYRVVSVRSTIPPGTMEETVIPILEQRSGKVAGDDFGAAFNPDYLRGNRAEQDFCRPWITVIGTEDETAWRVLEGLYKPFGSDIYRLPIKQAELHKYIHNLFNATKISFFNEMRQAATDLGIETETVFQLVAKSSEGMWNPAYGIRDLGPFDGSCLPKDSQAFLSFAQERSIPMPLLAAAIQVNESMSAQGGAS